MATLKHLGSKNADYGAAEQYLLFEHDEFTMKPVLDEKSIKRIWRFDSMNTRFTIEEENIVAIYAEDSRETTLENILAAMPYMDEDMRQLAAAAVNKLQAMTDSEFSEREFILTDEE